MIKNQFEWYSQRTRWTRDDFSGNDSRGLWPFFLFIIGCLSFKSEKIVQWIVGNNCYYVCGTIGEHWTRKQDGCPILREIDGELRNKSKVKWVYSLNRVAEKEMVLILDAIMHAINHRVKFQGYSVLHDQPLRSPAPENWALVLEI